LEITSYVKKNGLLTPSGGRTNKERVKGKGGLRFLIEEREGNREGALKRGYLVRRQRRFIREREGGSIPFMEMGEL